MPLRAKVQKMPLEQRLEVIKQLRAERDRLLKKPTKKRFNLLSFLAGK